MRSFAGVLKLSLGSRACARVRHVTQTAALCGAYLKCFRAKHSNTLESTKKKAAARRSALNAAAAGA